MSKKQDFLASVKDKICRWFCAIEPGSTTIEDFVNMTMDKVKDGYEAGYRAALEETRNAIELLEKKLDVDRTYEPVEPENTDDEEELQIPGVIIITDEIKKEYPELKNLQMMQKEPSDYMTWNGSIQYAKDLDLGGFNDWRLPTMEELRGIYRAKQALGIADDEEWYWSGSEAGASHAWTVYFSNGNVDYDSESNTNDVRCVR